MQQNEKEKQATMNPQMTAMYQLTALNQETKSSHGNAPVIQNDTGKIQTELAAII